MSLVVRPSRFLRYNAGAFVSEDEACLVDPGILADEVAALVAALDGATIRTVVLTHADWDHILGPEHLPPIRIVAHDAYLAELDLEGTRAELAGLEEHAGVVRNRTFEPPFPEETFEHQLTLEVGALELRLEHAPGHTASMSTLYEPASATLWAADMLSDVEVPVVAHDLEAYERTLERVSMLELATVVPGHGNPTSDPSEIAARLEEDRRYLAELREVVAQAVMEERTLDEAVDSSRRIALRRGPGDDTVHRLNTEKVFADLGGDADPEEVGFARARKEAIGT